MLGVSVTDTQHRHAHHTSLLHHSWQLTNSRLEVSSVPRCWDSETGESLTEVGMFGVWLQVQYQWHAEN